MQMPDLIGMVRVQIRDTGTPQAFADIATGAGSGSNTSPELTQFVVASLAEYSRWRPLRKPYPGGGLAIAQGTTTYPLPTDWMDVELASFKRAIKPYGGYCDDHDRYGDLDRWSLYDEYGYDPWANVQVAGLSNAQPALRYQFYNDLQQLILSEAPQANYTLQFDYWAQHQPVSGAAPSTLCTVPAQWLQVALLPACELALRALATDQTVKMQHYRMANGKLEVDNRTIKDALLRQADEVRERFRTEVVLRPIATVG